MNGKVSVCQRPVCHLCQCFRCLFLHTLHVLTDTVKDNNGIIDGISDNCKYAGNKCITYRNTDQCITRQHNKYIVYQCNNRTSGETDVLETNQI